MTTPARYFGFSPESTYAESPAPAAVHHIDITEAGIDVPDDPTLIYGGGLRRGPRIHRPGFYQPAGDLAWAIDIRTLPYLLYWVLGGYVFTDTAGATNTHEMYGTDSRQLPSFCSRVGKDLFEHVFSGCVADQLSLEVAGEFAEATLSVLAAKDAKAALVDVENLLLPAEYPLSFVELALELPSASDISVIVNSMTVSVNNNHDAESSRALGSRFGRRGPDAGERETMLELEIRFEDTDQLEAFWGGASGPAETGTTEFGAKILIDAGADGSAELETGRAIFTSAQQQPSGRDVLTQSLSVRAFDDEILLADGLTSVYTDLLATVINEEPELDEAS